MPTLVRVRTEETSEEGLQSEARAINERGYHPLLLVGKHGEEPRDVRIRSAYVTERGVEVLFQFESGGDGGI
jgi:hypothetical protein